MGAGCNIAPRRDRQQGFTLIEIAVVLLIITFLLGSLLVPLTAQVEQRGVSETEKRLAEIKEALVGYAIATGHLPCPAVSATNGAEDRDSSGCRVISGVTKRTGFLPWVTLGVPKADAWSNLFRYSVDPEFALDTQILIGEKGDIVIWTRNAAGAEVALTNSAAPEIPVVVLSHGPNGFGATSDIGITRATPSPWTTGDEHHNATSAAGVKFYSRIRGENTGATGGRFDDMVVWISPNVLISRMVEAGRY